MRQQDRLIWSAATAVRLVGIANRFVLAAIVIGLAATWLAPDAFVRMIVKANPAADADAALIGMRLLMLIGIVMTIAFDRMLAAMGAIIGSAAEGDPFAPINARRLQTIGWGLLTLQLLDIAAVLLARYCPDLGPAAPDGDISVGGWVATLMMFVLARIFAAGSAMRDDLAGTV